MKKEGKHKLEYFVVVKLDNKEISSGQCKPIQISKYQWVKFKYGDAPL